MSTPRTPRPAALLAALLAAGPAAAQPRPQPRAQPAQPAPAVDPAVEAEHARGIELRRQQRDGEAREVFRALYERTHEPRALARQAAAEAAMGDWLGAEAHLAEALAQSSDPWIVQQRAGLDGDLAAFREHVGLLEVTTLTPNAAVYIGGERVATLPLQHPIRVRSGTIAIELRAEGYLTEARTVDVPRGMRVPAREVFQLTPVPRGPTPLPPDLAGPEAPPPPPPPPPPPSGGVPPLRIAGFAVAAVGVVGIGLGAAALVLREGTVTAFNDDPTCGTNALTDACRARYDQGGTEMTLGIVGLAAGGALLAGGAAMVALSFRRPAPVAVSLAPRGLGLSLSGTF
ncbi:MAG: hypothetical protein U0324_35115 [Polyangiales bacterium]